MYLYICITFCPTCKIRCNGTKHEVKTRKGENECEKRSRNMCASYPNGNEYVQVKLRNERKRNKNTHVLAEKGELKRDEEKTGHFHVTNI